MAALINNVLDFARGRLGGGLAVNRTLDPHLAQTLTQVIDELALVWRDRTIRSELHINAPVACDAARIGQILSNLLGNALTHGDPASPVSVYASINAAEFELSVRNRGNPIAPETIGRLFQPFARASSQPGQQGLGLGLYIASEIAKAHAGTLEASSTTDGTRFTFRTPRT